MKRTSWINTYFNQPFNLSLHQHRTIPPPSHFSLTTPPLARIETSPTPPPPHTYIHETKETHVSTIESSDKTIQPSIIPRFNPHRSIQPTFPLFSTVKHILISLVSINQPPTHLDHPQKQRRTRNEKTKMKKKRKKEKKKEKHKLAKRGVL